MIFFWSAGRGCAVSHLRGVGNVAADEPVARYLDPGEVLEIPGVGQFVEVNNRAIAGFFEQKADERRPDKTSPTGHKDSSHTKQKIPKKFWTTCTF